MENKILGLRTAIYQVDDIVNAKRWYAAASGMELYFDELFFVGFDIGGFELDLQPEVEMATKAESVAAYWDLGGGIQVAKVKEPWDNIIGLIYNPYFKAS